MAWFIWGIAAFFYGYEFTQRVAPSGMVPELIAAFNLKPAAFGSLSAYYFYAYALFQVPAGSFIDHFGPRRVLTLAALTVALGSMGMACLEPLWQIKFARFAIGAGSAFAFVGCLKIAHHWLHQKHFPVMVGLTNLSGTLGAFLGGAPLAFMVTLWGWRISFMILGGLGFLIAYLLFAYVRLPRETHPRPALSEWWPNLKTIIHHPQTWWIALYAGLLVAPITGFIELWSVPFLSTAHLLTRPQAAYLNSLVFLGIALGGPSIGLLQQWTPAHPIQWCRFLTTLALLCLSAIIFIHPLPLVLLAILLTLYGFCTSNMLLCFTLVKRLHSPAVSGTALGLTNMVVMLGGAVFQPLIGWLLDYSILPCCLILAIGITFFIAEKPIQGDFP